MKNKIFFFIHSLRHGGAERIVLEINKYCNDKNLNSGIISWTDYTPYLKNSLYKNAKVIHLEKQKKYNWLYNLKSSLKKFNLFIKKENPSLIHINSMNAFLLVLLSNYKNSIIFLVHSYSFIDSKFFSKLLYLRILCIIFMRFKKIKIISVSKNIIPAISKFFLISKNKITYITNGVDINYFKKEKKIKNDLKKIKNIVMVGTLSKNKGQLLGVKIFNNLLKISSNYRLYIVGSGPDENEIKNFIIKNRLEDKIKIIPSTNKVKKYLNKSHIMWQLSVSEGLPLSILEAMSMGIPCIAYNVRGVNEIIKNNFSGILVNYGDGNEIIKKTIELFADKKKYKNFSKNSILHIKKNFNNKNYLSKHYSFINNILEDKYIYKQKIFNKIFLKIFPQNLFGDKLFNYTKHILTHKEIPYFKKSINNEILKIKTSNEILSLNRLKTTSKSGVKNFLKKEHLSRYAVPTLKIISNYNQLKKYKFKTNTIVKADHASGLIKFIMKKDDGNIKIFKEWLKHDYYKISRELNYKKLKKKLIVEPILFNQKNLIDYKFFCYHGVFKFCQLDIDRWGDHTRKFYDKQWNNLNFSILYPQYKLNVKKPRLLNKMIYLAEKIAKNFNSLIRVDMYTNDNQIYVGEITHCPGSGTEKFLPKEKEDKISKYFFS
jgi:glycosyltransferase involved in cell wall biosynthesis